MSVSSDIVRRFVEPFFLNVAAGLVAAAIITIVTLCLWRSGRLKKVFNCILSKIPRLKGRIWTISWKELQIGSKELLKKIQEGKIDNTRLFSGDKKTEKNKLYDELNKPFKPTVIFTPCCRGATIANAMFDTQNDRLPIYVGIRITNPKSASNDSTTKKAYKQLHDLSTGPDPCWLEVSTEKHVHFIPNQLIKLLKQNPHEKLLVLDDYASSGNSQKLISKTIKNKAKLRMSEIRTASFVVDRAAADHGHVHFWWKLNEGRRHEFYFPWGKAV